MNGRAWSRKDLTILAAMYPSRATKDIAAKLGRTVASVYVAADKAGLAKTEEYLRREVGLQKGSTVGAETRFPKGHVPANNGLRRPGWHAGRMKETQFRTGERRGKAKENWRPIGTILADSEGYLRIKVREAVHGKEATGFGNSEVWPLYARYIWQRERGPIPPGHVVAFIDRDRAHCVIENLELISRKELAARNRMWNQLPRELALAIQLNGALKRKIGRMGKNGKEQIE